MDESETIERVLGGERDAFDGLLARHSAPLLATLRARLRDREDARDVLQETWLRAYERLGELRDRTRLRSWLLTIALNLVRARRKRAPELALDGDEPCAPAGEGEHEHEELAELRARIAELPARQREVVDLRVNQELSHAEIAALLGITEEASRASHYQALKRLQAALVRARFERGGPA